MSEAYLFARDLAARRRVDVSTARRWLASLEKAHGARVVGRIGRRRYTTDRALAEVGPGWVAAESASERMRRMEERIVRLSRLVTGLAGRVHELEGARSEIVRRAIPQDNRGPTRD